MGNYRGSPNTDNPSYQHQMALNLLQSLGIEDAIDMCQRNDWHGTLDVILRTRGVHPKFPA